MHLCTKASVLVIFASIYSIDCLRFSTQDPLVFVLNKNTTNVVMKWKFTLETGERYYFLEVDRLESTDTSKKARLYSISDQNEIVINSTFYSASTDIKNGPSSGSLNFTVKNFVNQIGNSDGSPYEPISKNYLYRLEITGYKSGGFSKHTEVKAYLYASPTGPIALHVDNTTSKVNSTVNITCTAKAGNPPNTTLTFYRNNQRFREVKNYAGANATITINLDKPGVETFTCTAANLVGSSKNSSLLNLEVKASPMCPDLQADKTTFCHLNATVDVTCVATTGYPRNTTVTFYRNNVKFREVKNDADARATVTVTLDKLGVQTFACQAANLVGSSKNSSLLNIAVKDPPTITQCGNQTSNEGDALSWTCGASGSPFNTSWVKENENTIVSSTKAYNISSVNRSDAGMYRVTVSNGDECPTANTTVYLTVQYKPENLSVVRAQGSVLPVNKGQPINVTCTATGNPKPDYIWMFKGKQLSSPINSTIIISNATLDDDGMYTCTAINSIGRKSFNVRLQVNYIKDANCGLKIHTVKDGDNVTLNCSAIGIPAVNYKWEVTDKVYHRQTTTFKATKILNGTTATCTAKNSFGEKTCSQIFVVFFKPENLTVVNASKGTLDVDEGQLIDIICNADGYPDPYFLWQKSDQMIQSSNNKNNTITISNATSNDAGVYTCTAVNLVGNGNISVTLRVKFIGNAVCTAPDFAKEGDIMALRCSADGYPPVSYTWTTPGKVYQQSTANLTAIPHLNGVIVTCKATNEFKISTCSKKLTVYYKPRNVTVSPSSLVLNKTQSLTLTCDASANPAGNYSWSLNGKILEGEINRVLTKDNITAQDAGEYICTVNNTLGADTSKAIIHVQHISNAACSAPASGNEGDAMILNCSAVGYPPVSYTWTTPGKVYQESTANLTAIPDLNGVIVTCKATNKFKISTCNKTLTVYYKPHNVAVSPLRLVLNETETLTLTCDASANPAGNYSWSLNGKILEGESNRVLTKDNITAQDAGEYICTVDNTFGSGISKATVHVQYINDAACTAPSSANEGDAMVLNCSANGYPPVSYTWTTPDIIHQGPTAHLKATPNLNGVTVTCKASNEFKISTCSKKLTVYYLEGCKNITLGNKQCPTVSRKGYPEPELNCSLNGNFSVSQPEKDYRLCKPESNGSCTISNEAGKCHFGYEVQNQTKEPFDFRGTFRCTNRAYREEYGNENSQGFKKLKDELEQLLKLVYESFKIVTGIFVTAFHEGSVIVDFNLTLVANVNDPLSPLKDAVEKGGGNLSGFAIDPKSIKAGTTPTPTTPIPTTTKKPITTPSRISEEAIIAIAVVVPIVVILIIVLVWYFCCKKKEKRGEENISLEEGSPYRPVNGEENRGLSESQTSYARSGPKSDHNGQTTNNNPDTSDATATYAAVDMSKKKKKKQEGEVLYADLGSMRPGNNKGTELQPMSSSGNIPDKRESDYASIDFFKTQKQGEVKEYECLGTFTCTDRKYTKALDNEMTDSFKKLRDEVNKTVKSAYKDDTNFVLVEAEHFKWDPHGTIVIFKLILKEKVADPFLPLKEALEKNGGVVGAMKIIPQSVNEHEEEQNAPGEQKKAQKQDEANAAAKPNVGFLGGKETESSNQDNSSPESQADMSASRDNTTMTTVSL